MNRCTGRIKTVFRLVRVLSLAILLMLSFLACLDESEKCGDAMDVMEDGYCAPKQVKPKDTATHETPDSDTGTDTEPDTGTDTETGTEGDGLPEGMNAACSEATPCTGEADFCNQVPGASEGVCTIQGCTLDPDDCPAGYSCFDLSIFAASLPTICQQDE